MEESKYICKYIRIFITWKLKKEERKRHHGIEVIITAMTCQLDQDKYFFILCFEIINSYLKLTNKWLTNSYVAQHWGKQCSGLKQNVNIYNMKANHGLLH